MAVIDAAFRERRQPYIYIRHRSGWSVLGVKKDRLNAETVF